MAKRATAGTTAAGRPAGSRLRLGLLGTTVLQTALLLAVPARAQAPNAAPVGGSVAAGQATISKSATTTLIQQSSQRAAINWNSFNVGSQQAVQFQQPNATAVALNRVIGADPSLIAGRITANGEIVLINQSGVVFSGGSQVNAQALVVSTANISNHAFMAGGALHFDQPGKPGASIVNEGTITVGQAGLAALVAPAVANSGVITARLGQVTLAGATRYTLDLYGDGLLAIDVTGQVQQVPTGANGKPVAALVTNTGTIVAAGGTVTLTAAAADGLIKTLVSAGGHISANNAAGQGGTLVLDAIGGSIVLEGALTATGQTGGQVQAIASNAVQMAAGASVNVSGRKQGGVVALGTTLARAKGGPSVTGARTARTVQVAAGARIAADATGIGNGGRVTVLSTTDTEMNGTITARGGPSGGNGGFVEVSGQAGFTLAGPVDVSAPQGTAGTVLLDPTDLIVMSASSSQGTVTQNTPTFGTIYDYDINHLVGNVVLQATNNLSFVYTAGQSNSINLSAGSLTLQAGNNINIDRGWSITTTGLSMAAGYVFPTGPVAGTGSITIGSLIGATAAQPAVQLDGSSAGWNLFAVAASGGIALTDSVIGHSIAAGTIDLSTTGGGVSQGTAGVINAGVLQSTGQIVGPVTLYGTSNAIGTVGSITVTGNVLIVNGQSLAVTGPVSGGTVEFATYAGDLTLNAGATVSGTDVTLMPAGGAGSIAVGTAATDTATITASGSVEVDGAVAGGILQIAPSSSSVVALNATGLQPPARWM